MKKISINSIYIILNLIYIILGLFCAFLVFTSSRDNISYSIFIIIMGNLFLFFYIMSINFTILIHPIIQIIIYILVLKNKIISKKYIIIIFVLSLIMTFIFLYLRWGLGFILYLGNKNYNVRQHFA